MTAESAITLTEVQCAFCQGTGVYPRSRQTCTACGGVGVSPAPEPKDIPSLPGHVCGTSERSGFLPAGLPHDRRSREMWLVYPGAATNVRQISLRNYQ